MQAQTLPMILTPPHRGIIAQARHREGGGGVQGAGGGSDGRWGGAEQAQRPPALAASPAERVRTCARAVAPLLPPAHHPPTHPPAHPAPPPQAHNGSGKTTCFTLGMLARVDPSQHVPQASSHRERGGSQAPWPPPSAHLRAPAPRALPCPHTPGVHAHTRAPPTFITHLPIPSPPLGLQALCVCPTRELVVQNQMVLERMAKYTGGRVWGGGGASGG